MKNINQLELKHLRFFENNLYNSQLEYLTKFNIRNNLNQVKLNKIILTFSFKNIRFNENKVIPFLFALELLTGQKSSITLAKKPSVSLQVRKGMLSGCKVTLRRSNLFKFLESLNLALPRQENFEFINIKKKNNKTFNLILMDLFSFYQLESELDSNIKLLQITCILNSNTIEDLYFLLSSFEFPLKLN